MLLQLEEDRLFVRLRDDLPVDEALDVPAPRKVSTYQPQTSHSCWFFLFRSIVTALWGLG